MDPALIAKGFTIRFPASKPCHKRKLSSVSPHKRTSPRKASKVHNDLNQTSVEHFPSFRDESNPEITCAWRSESFELEWEKFKSTVEEVVTAALLPLKKTITDFVNDSFINAADSVSFPSFEKHLVKSLVLSGGFGTTCCAMKEHISAFLSFFDNFIIYLHPHDTKNVKSLLKCFVKQLLSNCSSPIQNNKVHSYDFQVIRALYKNLVKSKDSTTQPKIIVVFQDFEKMNHDVFSSFVVMASEHQQELPMKLIVLMTVSKDYFYHALKSSSTSLMETLHLRFPSSRLLINNIIKATLIDDIKGLKFSGDLLELLMEAHYYTHHSYELYMKHVKYAMMDYYFSNPLSFLKNKMDSIPNHEMDEILCPSHFNMLKSIPSFKRYIEKKMATDPDGVKMLLNESILLLEFVKKCKEDIEENHTKYKIAFCCIVEIQRCLEIGTTEKSLRDLLLLVLKEELIGSAYLDRLLLILRKSPVEKVSMVINGMLKVFHPFTILDDFFNKCTFSLENLQTKIQQVQKKPSQNADPSLRPIATELSDWIAQLCRTYLTGYQTWVFHELFYCNNPTILRQAFFSNPLASVQIALGDQEFYWQDIFSSSKGKEANHGGRKRSRLSPVYIDDTSLVYKLYLEAGKLINLYDMFVAFQDMLSKEKKCTIPLKEAQARFMLSIHELRHLGFVKETNKKADHVTKLIWTGDCKLIL